MKNPTVKDIAKEAGVSTATVSRVLNKKGYTSINAQEKVMQAVEKLNYFPNSLAVSLKTNKSYSIGIIIPDISNPFFMEMAKGLEDAIDATPYNLIFTSGMENSDKEKELLELLIEKRVDGIVIAPAGTHTELFMNVLKNNIPIVLVDRQVKGLSGKADYVVEDNFEGSYNLTKKLLKEKKNNIGVITGLLNVSTGKERLNGFKAAMKDKGIEIKDENIFYGDYTEESGRNAIKYFKQLPELPDAFLSLNNTMTSGVVKELLECKKPYDEIVIATYGEIEYQEYFKKFKIYSVRQNSYKMGGLVGKLILNKLTKKESNSKGICLPPLYNFNNKE